MATCKYVSDREQFGEVDYWLPPDQFEESKKGDCEDFALWTWRQLLQMRYPARFVMGTAGRYGDGHARVTFEQEGKTYLLDPLSWPVGLSLPCLSIIRYKPKFSVAWDGDKVSYYEHEDRKFKASLRQIVSMTFEWMFFLVQLLGNTSSEYSEAIQTATAQVLINAQTAEVGTGRNLSDFPTNQELDAVLGKSRRFRRSHRTKKMRLE